MKTLFLAALFLFTHLEASVNWKESAPGGFSASVHISSSGIAFEEPLYVDLAVSYPPGYSVNKNELRENLLRTSTPFATPLSLTDERATSTETTTNIHYTLEAQTPGDLTLSFYNIAVTHDQDKSVTFFSPLFPIRIVPSATLGSVTEPSPLLSLSRNIPVELSAENRNILKNLSKQEPERNLKIKSRKKFPWMFLLTLCLTGLGYVWIRFFRKPTISQKKRTLSARNNAWFSLKMIKADHLPWEEELYALSNTVRFYLEERYGIEAPKKTTQEFLESMSTLEFPVQFPKEQLVNFLHFSDQVKFAQSEASPEEREKAWKAAANLIES